MIERYGAPIQLYGTSTIGGTNNLGTIFSTPPEGIRGSFKVLPSFCQQPNCTDGTSPSTPLLLSSDTLNLFGTTGAAGTYGKGTIFMFSLLNNTLTVLHNFNGSDGDTPVGPLVLGTDGYLYGVTEFGGSNSYPLNNCGNSCGTIFRISTTGAFTSLYSFCKQAYCPDGYYPTGLVQHTNGNFYGTTTAGGTGAGGGTCGTCGTIFRLSMGLGPFIKIVPGNGTAGLAVFILGTNISGASSVTFNGIPAGFSIASPTEIIATVPSGNAGGTVNVVTPSGTLSSNVAFGNY